MEMNKCQGKRQQGAELASLSTWPIRTKQPLTLLRNPDTEGKMCSDTRYALDTRSY